MGKIGLSSESCCFKSVRSSDGILVTDGERWHSCHRSLTAIIYLTGELAHSQGSVEVSRYEVPGLLSARYGWFRRRCACRALSSFP